MQFAIFTKVLLLRYAPSNKFWCVTCIVHMCLRKSVKQCKAQKNCGENVATPPFSGSYKTVRTTYVYSAI